MAVVKIFYEHAPIRQINTSKWIESWMEKEKQKADEDYFPKKVKIIETQWCESSRILIKNFKNSVSTYRAWI